MFIIKMYVVKLKTSNNMFKDDWFSFFLGECVTLFTACNVGMLFFYLMELVVFFAKKRENREVIIGNTASKGRLSQNIT